MRVADFTEWIAETQTDFVGLNIQYRVSVAGFYVSGALNLITCIKQFL